MDAHSTETAPGELVSEVGGLMTGLGIISMTLFPFALPLIILTAVVALPLLVLGLPALGLWLLVRGVTALMRRRSAAGEEPAANTAPRAPAPRRSPERSSRHVGVPLRRLDSRPR
jgi:hypothetical protein